MTQFSRKLPPKISSTPITNRKSKIPSNTRNTVDTDVFSKTVGLFRDHMVLLHNRRIDDEEIEFEVHLGVFGGSNGTNDMYWSNAYTYCRNLPGAQKYFSSILDQKILTTTTSPYVIRKRTYRGMEPAWQAKKRIDMQDISDYWARLILSSETLTHEPEDVEETTTRWISRHTFIYKNARIDFSKTNTNGENTQEIEVEYLLNVPGYDVRTFINICKEIIREMFGSPLLFTFSQLEAVCRIANTYLDPNNISHRTYLDRSYFSEARTLGVGQLNFDGLFRSEGRKNASGKSIITSLEYFLSIKIEGERKCLIVSDVGTWLVFSPYHAQLLCYNSEHEGIPITILDTEHYEVNSIYFLHTLFLDGIDYRKKYFMEGYGESKAWRDRILNTQLLPNNVSLLFKEFEPVNNADFFEKAAKMLELTKETGMIRNDGLTLTPAKLDYFGLLRVPCIYKWKPVITIDFKVKIDKTGIPKLYTSDGVFREGEHFLEDFAFTGTPTNKFNNSVNLGSISCNSGSIVEFKWSAEAQELVAIRNRNDKTGANRTYVAEDNWKRMTQDNLLLDEKTLLCQNNTLVKKSHNRIKASLLKNAVKERTGLYLGDIGTGKGQDVGKWVDATGKPVFNRVFCIEPIAKNITELELRIAEYPGLKDRVHILQATGQDTFKIRTFITSYIGDTKLDIISMMDSLTFFFDPSGSDLNSLANTLKECLKPGGNFLWKMLDGDRVLDALKNLRSYDITAEAILKYGTDINLHRINDHQLNVSILPWILDQVEWISSVDRLRTTCKLVGIEKPAITETLLSIEYGAYSNLYSYGDFKLNSDISSLPDEVVYVYDTLVALSPPYAEKPSALEALENVFTQVSRKYIIGNYLKLISLVTPREKPLPGTPGFTYFESAFYGYFLEQFLNGRTFEELLLDQPTDMTCLVIANVLGIDVFIVNVDMELIATNSITESDRPCILLTYTTDGTYIPVSVKRTTILTNSSAKLQRYPRLPFQSVLETYAEQLSLIDLSEYMVNITEDSDTIYDTRGGVYERLCYIKSELPKENYLNLLAIVLKSKELSEATEIDLIYYKKFYPKAKVSNAILYLNEVMDLIRVRLANPAL